MPTLEGIVVTNSDRWSLLALLRQLRAVCDMVTVVVDDQAEAKSELCSLVQVELHQKVRYRIIRTPVEGYIETVLTQAYGQVQADWVIRLDDDELLSTQFVTVLPGLLASPYDYFRIARAHVTEHDASKYLTDGFIAGGPPADWWPNRQLRLFRKGHCSHRGTLHEGPQGIGYGTDVMQPILHFNLLKPRDERERLMQHYRDIDPAMADRGGTLLWEDYDLQPRPCPFTIWVPEE